MTEVFKSINIFVLSSNIRAQRYGVDFSALICTVLPEAFELADVPVGQRESFRTAGVKVVFVLIPPHLHHTDVVLHARAQQINV